MLRVHGQVFVAREVGDAQKTVRKLSLVGHECMRSVGPKVLSRKAKDSCDAEHAVVVCKKPVGPEPENAMPTSGEKCQDTA